jgi:hypothetical protein
VADDKENATSSKQNDHRFGNNWKISASNTKTTNAHCFGSLLFPVVEGCPKLCRLVHFGLSSGQGSKEPIFDGRQIRSHPPFSNLSSMGLQFAAVCSTFLRKYETSPI